MCRAHNIFRFQICFICGKILRTFGRRDKLQAENISKNPKFTSKLIYYETIDWIVLKIAGIEKKPRSSKNVIEIGASTWPVECERKNAAIFFFLGK